MSNALNLFQLTGTVCVVTGGGKGLGSILARTYAEAGARVVISGRDGVALRATADAINAECGAEAVVAAECNVADEESVDRLAAGVLDRFGRVDVLVNNAGVTWGSPLEEMRLKDWQKVLDVNLTGTFLCTQRFGRAMLRQRQGNIICISSVAAARGIPFMSAPSYGSSKAAVEQFVREAAVAWAPHNIRVNALRLGFFESKMIGSFFKMPGKEEQTLTQIPMGRVGRENDLCGVALFLASEASRFMTGSIMTVDGGMLAAIM